MLLESFSPFKSRNFNTMLWLEIHFLSVKCCNNHFVTLEVAPETFPYELVNMFPIFSMKHMFSDVFNAALFSNIMWLIFSLWLLFTKTACSRLMFNLQQTSFLFLFGKDLQLIFLCHHCYFCQKTLNLSRGIKGGAAMIENSVERGVAGLVLKISCHWGLEWTVLLTSPLQGTTN